MERLTIDSYDEMVIFSESKAYIETSVVQFQKEMTLMSKCSLANQKHTSQLETLKNEPVLLMSRSKRWIVWQNVDWIEFKDNDSSSDSLNELGLVIIIMIPVSKWINVYIDVHDSGLLKIAYSFF